MPWSDEDDVRLRKELEAIDVGKLMQCPKCGMGESGAFEAVLASFCTHKYCPFREWRHTQIAASRALDPYYSALDAWRKNGGPRPEKRPDGILTRIDTQWTTPAEKAIRDAMIVVENAGGSLALTDAVTLLDKAKNRVADHAEGKE